MTKRVLLTGGPGFVGAALAELLLSSGHRVTFLASVPVLQPSCECPRHILDDVEQLIGDVCDPGVMARALKRIDAVIHLAPAVSASDDEAQTAALLQGLARNPVERLVCATSARVYGEGVARGTPAPAERPAEQLRRGVWDVLGEDGQQLEASPIIEDAPLRLASRRARSQHDQERMCLEAGKAIGIGVVALRLFNVYGPRQAPASPGAGALVTLATRLLAGRPPLVFEDGGQTRDFLHVEDAARACLLAMESAGSGEVYNIGSGEPRPMISAARDLALVMGCDGVTPHVLGKHRHGDVRHRAADISRARLALGFEPRIDFHAGIEEMAGWLAAQAAIEAADGGAEWLEAQELVA